MKHLAIRLVAIAAICVPPSALAQTAEPVAVQVEQPWARASAGAAGNGVAYLTLKNAGPGADRLLSGTSPVADRVEFHTHVDDDGVMRMRRVGAIAVGPGEPVVFRPGGLHVMLIGLHAPLTEGARFALTLTFERSGTMTVDVPVRAVGASGPQPRHGRHGDDS